MSVDHAKRGLFKARLQTEQAMRPPWSGSDERFIEHCTRCNACVDSCETQIIKIGSGGFPEIDFSKDECTFCEACADACPSPALDKATQARFNNNIEIDSTCFAKNSIFCQSCKDACDYQAIDFKLARIPQPELNHDNCTSCGACVSSCPQNSIKITVNNGEAHV